MEAKIYVSGRIRKSPFFERTLAAGASQFSVYNKTYLVGGFSDMESEFWSVVNDVALWDVTCQRIVEISGSDAAEFTSLLTPRDLTGCKVGQCRYVLITNTDGGILNDPVLLRLAENRYWLSRADSDILMWARGVAVNAGLDVSIHEPDTATLQLQGPKSVDVLKSLVGDQAETLGYYHHVNATISGIPVLVARTGWSAERGYELYLLDTQRGEELWDLIMQAGKPFNIAPGVPSRIRRIEAGILDYSVDMDDGTNPYEVGLGRLVDLDTERDFIGKPALVRIRAQGVSRMVVGLEIEGAPVSANDQPIAAMRAGREIGSMTSWVYSPRLERNIGFAMLDIEHTEPGTEIEIGSAASGRKATVVPYPFVDPKRELSRARSG